MLVMTTKLRLDIPILLPNVPDATDPCVERLVADLQARPGVEGVHVRPAEGDSPAQLCIHYSTEFLTLSRIRDITQAAGARITSRFGHGQWQTVGIGHQRRAETLSEQLRLMPGVLEAAASATGRVHVEFDRQRTSEAEIFAAMTQMGLRLSDAHEVPSNDQHGHGAHPHAEHGHGKSQPPATRHAHSGEQHDHAHAHGGVFGANTEMAFALICGALLGIGFAIEKLAQGLPEWLPLACYVVAYFFGGFYTVREAM